MQNRLRRIGTRVYNEQVQRASRCSYESDLKGENRI